jgi:hypothetical protein
MSLRWLEFLFALFHAVQLHIWMTAISIHRISMGYLYKILLSPDTDPISSVYSSATEVAIRRSIRERLLIASFLVTTVVMFVTAGTTISTQGS